MSLEPLSVFDASQAKLVVNLQRLFTLQRMGIRNKFLYFPDENHWVLKPANSILWHDTVLDWLDRWTKRDGQD